MKVGVQGNQKVELTAMTNSGTWKHKCNFMEIDGEDKLHFGKTQTIVHRNKVANGKKI